MVLSLEKCVTSTELLDFELLALPEVSPANRRVPVQLLVSIAGFLQCWTKPWLC